VMLVMLMSSRTAKPGIGTVSGITVAHGSKGLILTVC
jgi:hypothetical protein